MNKITPYTAFCDIFQCKEKFNHKNCRKNNIEDVTKYRNVASLQNYISKKVPQVDNSCQTQPLRDYAMEKIMKAAKTKYSEAQFTQSSIIKDDNFQILHPDYAAYSEENLPARNRFKTIAERPCTANDERKESNNKKRQTTRTNLKQEDVRTVPYNPYKNTVYETQFSTTTNYPKLKYKTKYSPVRSTRQFTSGLRNMEVNALYKTVSNLKTAFADKYNHIHNEKCFCNQCGALSVIEESLKRPMICDHSDEEIEEEQRHRKKHRKHQSRRDKYDDKEYIKLMTKVKKMQERLEDLESLNYVDGPFKQKETIDSYTQCEKKQTRFAEPECRRDSPKKFCQSGCPFSFIFPHNLKENIKEKIFRRKSADEKSSIRSEESSSDYSDYKFKPVKQYEIHEKSPKPKLRCHAYMSQQKDQSKKSSLKSSLKPHNVQEDTENNGLTEKNIQDLLFEISNVRSRSPTSTLEADKVRFYLKSKQTGVLYLRNNAGYSSESCVQSDMKFMMEQSKNTNGKNKVTELTSNSNQTYYNKHKNQNDCLLLRDPNIFEKLVRSVPEKNLDHFKRETPKTSTNNKSKPAVRHPTNNIFLSNDTYVSSRKYPTTGAKQNKFYNVIHSMKSRHTDFYGNTSTDKTTFNSSIKKTDEATTLVENITVSTKNDTTDERSFSQYSNYADKFSTEDSIYSNVIHKTLPAYNRSRSSSPANIKHTCNTIIEKTRKKKSDVTINDKKAKFVNRNTENQPNQKVKNFVEVNKIIGHSGKLKSPKRSPQRSNEESKNHPDDMLVNYFFNKKTKDESKEKEVNNRKKWNFSFLDIKTDSVKKEKIEKANKKQIIQQLSKLSNFSTTETDSTSSISEESNDIIIPNKKPAEKDSIFRLIKRYSNKLLRKRKSKPNPPEAKTFSGITKLKTKLKPVDKNVRKNNKKIEIDKTKYFAKRKSKIPVYIYSDRKTTKDVFLKPEQSTSNNKATNTKKDIKKLNKYCLIKPVMADKDTVLSNETIYTEIASKINAEYEEINNAKDTERHTESMNTLLVNSVESITQEQHNTSMNNIIIFNSSQTNCNTVPIISKQSSNNKLNNLSVQTNVLDNLMPTFFWNKYPPDKLSKEDLAEINKYEEVQNTQKKINTVCETVTSYSIKPNENSTNINYVLCEVRSSINSEEIKTSGTLQNKKMNTVCAKMTSSSIEPNKNSGNLNYSINEARSSTYSEEIKTSGSLQNTQNIQKKINPVCENVTSYSIEPSETSTLYHSIYEARSSTNSEEIKTSGSLQNTQNIQKKINPVCENVTSYSIEPSEISTNLNHSIYEARSSTNSEEIKTSGSLQNTQNIQKKINPVCENVTSYSIEPSEISTNLNHSIYEPRSSTNFEEIRISGSLQNTQIIKTKINPVCEKVTSYSIEPSESTTNLNYNFSVARSSTNIEEIKTSGSLQNTHIENEINTVCEKVTSYTIDPHDNYASFLYGISEANNFKEIKKSCSLQNTQNIKKKTNEVRDNMTSYFIELKDIISTNVLYGVNDVSSSSNFPEIQKSESLHNTQNIQNKINPICEKVASYSIEPNEKNTDFHYDISEASISTDLKEIKKTESLLDTKKMDSTNEHMMSYSDESNKETTQMSKSSLEPKKINENNIEINFLTKIKKKKPIKKKVSISSDLPSRKSSTDSNKNKKTKSKQEKKKKEEQKHPKKKRVIYESEGVSRKRSRESLENPSKVSKKDSKTKMGKKTDKKGSAQSVTSSLCSCSLPHVAGANSSIKKAWHSQLVGCKSNCKNCTEVSKVSSKTKINKCKASPSNNSITPFLKLLYGPGEKPKQRKPKKEKLCNKCAQKSSYTGLNSKPTSSNGKGCNKSKLSTFLKRNPSECSCSRQKKGNGPGEASKNRKLKKQPSKSSLECSRSSLLVSLIKGKKKKNCEESPCNSKSKLTNTKKSTSNCSCKLSNRSLSSTSCQKQSKQTKKNKKCRSPKCLKVKIPRRGVAELSPSSSKMTSIQSNSSRSCSSKCKMKKMSTLQKMKNKIASTFNCDFLKNLYRRPAASIGLSQRNSVSNICDDCLKELDNLQNSSRKTSSTLLCSTSGKNKSSVVNVCNMQGFRLDSTGNTSRSNSNADSIKTIEEKLYLLQNFFFRMQYEGCTSDNEPLENP